MTLKFIGLLSGPNDSLVAIQELAEPLAWGLLAATAMKYLATTAVSHFYPQRLLSVYPTAIAKRSRHVTMLSLTARAGAAFVVFVAFLGLNWLVVVLLALYLVDVVLPDMVRPKNEGPWWAILIPSNLGKILFLSVVSAISVLTLENLTTSNQQLVLVSLTIVMVAAIANNVAAARWPTVSSTPQAVLYIGGFLVALLTFLQLTDHLIKT